MRHATEDDIPRLLAWGRLFHEAGGLRCAYDEETVAGLLRNLIASDAGVVIVSDTGFIGGLLSPAYCDPKWVMAVELFWWAEKNGLQLLHKFEEWASDMGAQEVRMTSLAELPRADGILRRKGYAPLEISYQKVI